MANHAAEVDDVALWSALFCNNPRSLSRVLHMRWTLGAKEIMFKNKIDSTYFSLARVIPVERGKTVYQEGKDTSQFSQPSG